MGVNEALKNHAEECLTRIDISINIEYNGTISRISTILDLLKFHPFCTHENRYFVCAELF